MTSNDKHASSEKPAPTPAPSAENAPNPAATTMLPGTHPVFPGGGGDKPHDKAGDEKPKR